MPIESLVNNAFADWIILKINDYNTDEEADNASDDNDKDEGEDKNKYEDEDEGESDTDIVIRNNGYDDDKTNNDNHNSEAKPAKNCIINNTKKINDLYNSVTGKSHKNYTYL